MEMRADEFAREVARDREWLLTFDGLVLGGTDGARLGLAELAACWPLVEEFRTAGGSLIWLHEALCSNTRAASDLKLKAAPADLEEMPRFHTVEFGQEFPTGLNSFPYRLPPKFEVARTHCGVSQVGDECTVMTAVGQPKGRNRFLALRQERRVAMMESCHDRSATEWELQLLVT
jgi:hypothetical protein